MFQPASIFIGLRYLRAKQHAHFISFISAVSMVGITLGVAVLITVLSVMNGFDQQIHRQLFGLARQVTVVNHQAEATQWRPVIDSLKSLAHVKAVAPFASGQAMLNHAGLVGATLITGIDPKQEARVSELNNKMISGKLSSLTPGKFNLVLGEDIAAHLGVTLGDLVTVIVPEATVTPAVVIPRFRRFTVSGIFSASKGFGFNQLAFIHLGDAQRLYQLDKHINGIRIKMDDQMRAPQLSRQLNTRLPTEFIVTDWTDDFGQLFNAIQLEKTMMFLILLLLIAIAAFNLVSTMVMVVTEKRSEIAILRTMGATPKTILGVFMMQGLVIGIVGISLGVIGGILLSLNVTEIVQWIEQQFHLQLISSNIYLVDYLPSHLMHSDVIRVALAAFVMTLIATLYPAWRASRTDPARALRYE